MKLLNDLRDGTAPRPRHHSYSVESPIRAYYQHFTSGVNVGFLALPFWIGVWPVLLFVFKRQIRKEAKRAIFAYVITLAVMGALDGILALIGTMCPPGPVSESVEFAFALVNLPAWIVVGNSLGSWYGLILGDVAWATIVSMVVLCVKPDRSEG